MSTTSTDSAAGAPAAAEPPAQPPENSTAQQTPTLNTLLAKPSEQFASPQPSPRGPRPESRDRYAATANAVAAGAGAYVRNPQLAGVQQQEWGQPPRSPASPAGSAGYPAGDPSSAPHPPPHPTQPPHPQPGPPPTMPPPPGPYGAPHPGYPPPGAPPPQGYWGPRPGMPPGYPPMHGYPPHPGYHLPPGYHPGYGPPHPGMMPGRPGDMVKMPPGPNPMEWAAMQRQREANREAVPSPADVDDKARMESPSWNHGQYPGRPGPPHMMPPHPQQPPPQPAPPPVRNEPTIVDRLVGPVTSTNPLEVMPARREFFEKLVTFCERHGEPITMIPQVSKQNVDLHRLYIAVRNKGGFEKVTREKAWKAVCTEANPDLSESSAAGYQLRRHYQKHLLLLECMETGRSAEDAVAFADKLKKKKKEPAGGGAQTPGTAGRGSGGAPSTRGRRRKVKDEATSPDTTTTTGQHPQQSQHQQPSTSHGMPSPMHHPHHQQQHQQNPQHHRDSPKVASANATWYPAQPGASSGYLAAGGQRIAPQAYDMTGGGQTAHQHAYYGAGGGMQQQQHPMQQAGYYQQHPQHMGGQHGGGGGGYPGISPSGAPSPYDQSQHHLQHQHQQQQQYAQHQHLQPPSMQYPGYGQAGSPRQHQHQHQQSMQPMQHAMAQAQPQVSPQSGGHHVPSPYAQYAMSMYHQQAYYRSRGMPYGGQSGYGGGGGYPPQGAQPSYGGQYGYQAYPAASTVPPAGPATGAAAGPGTPAGPGSTGAPSPFPGGGPPPAGYYPGGGPPGGAGTPGPAGAGYYPPGGPYPPGAMRPPHMEGDGQPGANAGGAPATPYSQPPATPASGVQGDSNSRAPSAGPAGAATPDSSSRMSATDAAGGERPTSAASNATGGGQTAPGAQHPPSALTPTPGHPGGQAQQPSTSMAPMAPTPHFGQPPPMYPSAPQAASRPGGGAPPPPGVYPPGAYGGYPPPPQGYPPPPHPMHQQQYMQHQQQMWHAHQQQQAAAAAAARGGYPPATSAPNGAAGGPRTPYYGGGGGGGSASGTSAGGQPTPQRMGVPGAQSAPSPGGAGTPAGSAAQRMKGYPPPQPYGSATPLRAPPPTMAASASHAGTVQPPGPAGSMMMGSSYQQQTTTLFPPGSVEASTISQQRRRRLLTRDLIGATPRRLLMTLRCAMDTEVVWALNALTVILHDDTLTPPSLNQMPGLLSVLVEHLQATLHVLWPDEFPIGDEPEASVSASGLSDEEEKIKAALKGPTDTVKAVVATREKKNSEKAGNFTKTTRTGRKVHYKEAEMPDELKRRLLGEVEGINDCDPSCSTSKSLEGSSVVHRVVNTLKADLEAARRLPKPKFRIRDLTETERESMRASGSLTDRVKSEAVEEEEEESSGDVPPPPFYFRLPNRHERAEYPNDVELDSRRPTALVVHDAPLSSITSRALSLSNIIRGFSFLPGNEAALAAQPALLRILGKFLKLCVHERLVKKVKPPSAEDEQTSPFLKPPTLLDPQCSADTMLREVATQLREDAFVVLCHLSVVLDLYEMEGDVSYGILDGLLHWAISATAEATDNLLHGIISPRDYALEALCKLCVLERNVDLLLSTGPWPRIERLVKVLTKLLPMHEEVHHREFAIVILSSLCMGSEPVCWTTAVDTNAIVHLLNFIEAADLQMHSVMQSHGMTALRDNPELMGTSVGMLRRAASTLRLLTRVEDARKTYAKQQSRLIQFTMSQLMDSRVAGMVAESLYEIQRAEMGRRKREKEEEEEGEKIEKKEGGEERGSGGKGEGKENEEMKQPELNGHSSTGASSTSSNDGQQASTNKEEETKSEKKAVNGVKTEKEGVEAVKKEEEDEEDNEEDDSQPAPTRKGSGGGARKRTADESPAKDPSKRAKVVTENGFASDSSEMKQRNGEMASGHKKALKMNDSPRTENGSAMTAVA